MSEKIKKVEDYLDVYYDTKIVNKKSIKKTIEILEAIYVGRECWINEKIYTRDYQIKEELYLMSLKKIINDLKDILKIGSR